MWNQMISRAVRVVAIGLTVCGSVVAQEDQVVVPGDPRLDRSRLDEFEAEYDQMGASFRTILTLSGDQRPVWSFTMLTSSPRGVGVDHVAHFADDLSFAYRRFRFGAFRPEYIDVASEDGGLMVRRMPTSAEGGPLEPVLVPTEGSVFDGTFIYWILGLLTPEPDTSLRFSTWSATAEAAQARVSSPVQVGHSDWIVTADGARYQVWPYVSESAQGSFRSWIAQRPPFLIRQDLIGEDDTVTTVVDLKWAR